MIKAIFWDMDGTMVDTEPQWGVATYELSELMGRRITPEIRESTIGGSMPRTIRICAAHAASRSPGRTMSGTVASCSAGSPSFSTRHSCPIQV